MTVKRDSSFSRAADFTARALWVHWDAPLSAKANIRQGGDCSGGSLWLGLHRRGPDALGYEGYR